ncbi:hypothetical protein BKA62DRAFT_829220 [Auriculariales sp. MPI-PUGE-AT-0066]|nr:hypothetical protein BKA62DRAFT_829220 [Auriculariales sp. MPI-PUGE-AT-0066]
MALQFGLALNDDVIVSSEYAVPGHEITRIVGTLNATGIVPYHESGVLDEKAVQGFIDRAREHRCQAVVSLKFTTNYFQKNNYVFFHATAMMVQLRKRDSDPEPNTDRASMLQPNSNVYTYDDGV